MSLRLNRLREQFTQPPNSSSPSSSIHPVFPSPLSSPVDSSRLTSIQLPSSSSSFRMPSTHDSRFSSCSPLSSPLSTPPLSSRAPRLLTSSSLRPPVHARDRLFAWSSSFSVSRRLADQSLPSALLLHARHVALKAYAPATLSSYGSALVRFTQFCDNWSIHEDLRMPASAELLSAFASFYAGSVSGSTISSWLSGLQAWHSINGAPWYGTDPFFRLIRSAADKLGTSYSKPSRAPVSITHLRSLKLSLSASSHRDVAIWAVALVTFFGCRRLGETTVRSIRDFSPMFNAIRDTPITFRDVGNGCSSASISIPWTKTTKQKGGTIIITSRNDDLCPVTALRNHLRINCSPPPGISLFGYRQPDLSWSHMLKKDFIDTVLAHWLSAGLDRVSGHSFRIGGTVELLLSGVSPEVVAATGGWTSLAFLRYWRRVEEIIPLCTSSAYSAADLSCATASVSSLQSSLMVSSS